LDFMGSSKRQDFDMAIERVLRGEALRPVPPTLARRIKQRIALLALIHREQSRFRHALAAGIGILATVLTTGVAVALLTGIPTRLVGDVPGAMGYWDYVKIEVLLSLPLVLGILAILFALPVGAMLVTALWPSRKSADKFHDPMAV
jgi:hypothetical protein